MKKIIDGVKYDTETARLVFSETYPNLPYEDLPRDDRHYYLKKNGGCFVCTDGNEIWPFDSETLRRMVEERFSVDEYEEIFGPVDE